MWLLTTNGSPGILDISNKREGGSGAKKLSVFVERFVSMLNQRTWVVDQDVTTATICVLIGCGFGTMD
jgi:hypothetical protein